MAEPQPAAVEEPAPEPDSIGESFEIAEAPPAPVSRGLLGTAEYDLPVVANQWVEMELSFLVNQRHDVIGRWLERADRYDEFVRDVFARYGIPRDLHHLAMVESGYQPAVRSRAGAVGMWQFMPGTGRGMGLRIDDLVDERMDPVRSTHAAARHLRELHRDFGGDWALAAAAYNAGGGRISRGMTRFGARDFWDLAERGDLAQETRHYVPRLYAVTIIAKDPGRFGYAALAGAARAFAFDSVRVDVVTPLAELARIGNLAAGELADLNPHLFRGIAPALYWVWVPAGQGPALQQAFRDSDFRRRGGYALYTLRRGEDLASIAAATGLAPDQIRDLNLSLNVDRLGRGDRIRLWADAARLLESRPVARVASRDDEDEGRERSSSRAGRSSESGESRESRSSGSRESSRAKSAEEGPSRREGERTASRDAGRERSGSSETRRRSSGEEESSRGRSSESGERRRSGDGEESASSRRGESSSRGRTHTVEQGETLWGIARRYELTVARVREANDLDEDEAIQPGQKLRIPRASPSPARVASRDGGSSASRRSEGERGRGEPSSRGRVAEHVVKSGETLWSIARAYDSSVEAIRDANGMDADSVLQPGQKLRVPRTSSDR
ncbi:MAG TPA: LysM peptidoglycan-binding domain-containing protein [Longimicrobium sp.]